MTGHLPTAAQWPGPRLAGWPAALRRALRDGGGALDAHDDLRAKDRRRTALDLGVLGLLGAATVALSLWAAHWRVLSEHPRSFLLTLLAQLVAYGLAAGWVVWRRPRARWTLALILLVALGSRLPLIGQTPGTSDDIYRYVWDGRIQAAGINPYRYPPSDPALAPYRDDTIYPLINRKGVPTIYPPVAQFAFRALDVIGADSVARMKLALVGLDLLTIAAIAGLLTRLGLHPGRALLYAWHPLLLYEVAHAGHLDVLTILFLVLAVRARVADRPLRVGFLLACAALTKFYAVIALPALLDPRRRWDLRLPLALVVTIALAYLPFLGVGGRVFGYLGGYVQEEGLASGERFYFLQLLGRLPGLGGLVPPAALPQLTGARLYTAALVVAMGALALWCWLRPLPTPRAIPARALLLFTLFLILTTPSYPWYALLVLVLIPFAGRRLIVPTSLLVGTVGFLYLQWWEGVPWPRDLAWGGSAVALAAVAIWALVGALRRPRPGGPGGDGEGGAKTGAHPPLPLLTPSTGPGLHPDREVRASLFDRFPWLYAACREWFFRDHTARIAAAPWPGGEPRRGERMLEPTCGPGFYTRRLARRFGQLEASGLDRSRAQLGYARRLAGRRPPANCRFTGWGGLVNCRFIEGDGLALRQTSGSIDAIIVSRLFTILPAREGALREMYRVLGIGGRCFIAEPRSRLWTALPLRALWALSGVARLLGGDARRYRERPRATVLTAAEFGALVASQPWLVAGRWQDRYYHHAVCQKLGPAVEALAADQGGPGP